MRYLILKTSAFGDVVQAFCVLHYLKSIEPDCEIDWVVEKKIAPLVRAHPLVSNVIEVNAKEWKKSLWKVGTWKEFFAFIKELQGVRYDALFDLQGNAKSALLGLFCSTRAKVGFGWNTAPERVNCCFVSTRSNPPKGQNIRRDYLYIVQNYFKNSSTVPCERVVLSLTDDEKRMFQEVDAKVVGNAWMVCPGSAWENKQMSQEALCGFLKKIDAAYHPLFVFAGAGDKEARMCRELAELFPNSFLAHNLSIPVLQHLMQKMELVISMDSFPLHLAGTTDVATLSIFGPSVSFKYRPLGERHFSFQGSCPYGYSFEKRCPVLRSCKTASCMKDISCDVLFDTFSKWWGQKA